MAQSAYFKLVTSSVSQTCVEYLDVTVQSLRGYLVVQPTLAKIPSPLHVTSCHPEAVLRSWPQAVVRRALDLASNVQLAMTCLLKQYMMGNVDPITFSRLCNARHVGNIKVPSNQPCARVAFIIRFHPAFHFAVKQARLRAPMPLEFNLDFMPSWFNALASTFSLVTKANIMNAKTKRYNDPGTIRLSEEGGKIVVVPPSSMHSPRETRPIHNINVYTITNQCCVFCP